MDFITELKKNYELERIDTKEYGNIRVGMMRFRIESYDIKGIGCLSIMDMKALCGLMRMSTVIINPLFKDAPLFSYDYIKAFGKETLFLELYNTCLKNVDVARIGDVKKKYSYLKDGDVKPNWYDYMKMGESLKKIEKGKSEDFALLTKEYLSSYQEILLELEDVGDIGGKHGKSKEYVDGLLNEGGPSTDVFVKKIGKEKTRELFYKYLFGIER